MSPITSVLLTLMVIALLAWVVVILFDKGIDELWPPSHEEIARRLQEKATKDLNRRHRVQRASAWNWW